MTDRLAPITVMLTGTPRTGVANLGTPRPSRTIQVRRTGETTAALTVELETGVIELRLGDNGWFGNGLLDGYEFRVTADAKMTTLTLFDDLEPVRAPVTPAQIAEWEESWAERLAKMEAAPNAGA
jgi:hypothetical protein